MAKSPEFIGAATSLEHNFPYNFARNCGSAKDLSCSRLGIHSKEIMPVFYIKPLQNGIILKGHGNTDESGVAK